MLRFVLVFLCRLLLLMFNSQIICYVRAFLWSIWEYNKQHYVVLWIRNMLKTIKNPINQPRPELTDTLLLSFPLRSRSEYYRSWYNAIMSTRTLDTLICEKTDNTAALHQINVWPSILHFLFEIEMGAHWNAN